MGSNSADGAFSLKEVAYSVEISTPEHLSIPLNFRQVLHTPCPEIWHGQLHMYFSGLKENLCSCSHIKSQAINFETRSMKFIVHGLSYVDIIQKKIRDMKCEEYCPCHILRDI